MPIVANFGGGGANISGSPSVQPNWMQNDYFAADYIKNRPFYTTDYAENYVLKEQSITVGEDLYTSVSLTSPLVENETYYVNFNDTMYQCVGWKNSQGGISVGNDDLSGTVNDEESDPFCLDSYENGDFYITVREIGDYTISIKTREKLQPVSLFEGIVVTDSYGEQPFGIFTLPTQLVESQTYIVTLNGTEHRCVATNNGSYAYIIGDTFMIESYSDFTARLYVDQSGEYTLSIQNAVASENKLVINWDGDTTGKTVVSNDATRYGFCKVSDLILSDDEIRSAILVATAPDGTTNSTTMESLWDKCIVTDDYILYEAFAFIKTNGVTYKDLTFEYAGVYFMYYILDGETNYVSKLETQSDTSRFHLTWDGDVTGRTVITGNTEGNVVSYACKISDVVLSDEDIKNIVYHIVENGATTSIIRISDYWDAINDAGYVTTDYVEAMHTFIVKKDNVVVDNLAFEKAGIYVMCNQIDGVSISYVSEFETRTNMHTVTIEWDHSTDGLTPVEVASFIPIDLYRVSDRVFSNEEIKAGTITFTQNGVTNEQSVAESINTDVANNAMVVTDDIVYMVSVAFVRKDNITIIDPQSGQEITFHEAGVYFGLTDHENFTYSIDKFETIVAGVSEGSEDYLIQDEVITVAGVAYGEIPYSDPFITGQTYLVTLDGIQYECVAWGYDDNQVYLGDESIYGMNDPDGGGNGEPFLISVTPYGYAYFDVTTTGTHQVLISAIHDNVVLLPEKYLQNSNVYNGKTYGSLQSKDAVAVGRGSTAFGLNTTAYGIGSFAEGASTQDDVSLTLTGDAFSRIYTVCNRRIGENDYVIGRVLQYGDVYAAILSADSNSSTILLDRTLSDSPLVEENVNFIQTGLAAGYYSHAEGFNTSALGYVTHAEGYHTYARGECSHVEGYLSETFGDYSHAEGLRTHTDGRYAHAEGNYTRAIAGASHSEGEGTIINDAAGHVQGKWNYTSNGAHIVGNGSSNVRSDAHTLDWDGNAWFAGEVYVGSTSGKYKDDGAKKLVTVDEVAKSDWSVNNENNPAHIMNRTHWAEDVVVSTVLDNQTVNINQLAGNIIPLSTIVLDDNSYFVSLNGSVYECTSYAVHSDTLCYIVGNAHMYDKNMPDTGEPFCIENFINGSYGFLDLIADKAGEYELVIYDYSSKPIFTGTVTTELKYEDASDRIPVDFEIVADQQYNVIFDEVTYSCTAGLLWGNIVLGNKSLYSSSEEDTREPFYIEYEGDKIYVKVVPGDIHTISILANDSGTTLLSKTTLHISYKYATKDCLYGADFFNDGQTYNVSIDGSTYKCVGWVVDDGGWLKSGVGNGSLVGFEDIGEDVPFCFSRYADDEDMIFTTHQAVGIYSIKIETQENDEELVILKEQKVNAVSQVDKNSAFKSVNEIVCENQYKVTYDGIDYYCKAWCDEFSNVYLGNAKAFGASWLPGNDEPFCISIEKYSNVDENGETYYDGYVLCSTNGQHTLSIGLQECIYHTLSEDFCPPFAGKSIKCGTEYYPDGDDGWSYSALSGSETFNDYDNNIAFGQFSHSEGSHTMAGDFSHAEGVNTAASDMSHAEGVNTTASYMSHAEGHNTISLNGSHAEGWDTIANGTASHAEGAETLSAGHMSHAEGASSAAYGEISHAEGRNTFAAGISAHTEGSGHCFELHVKVINGCRALSTTDVNIRMVHPGCYITLHDVAEDPYASYRPYKVTLCDYVKGMIYVDETVYSGSDEIVCIVYDAGVAGGYASHVEGYNTLATGRAQHVQGEWNLIDECGIESAERGKYVHIVGNGQSGKSRSNAHTLDWDGNAWFQGDVYVGGTGYGCGKDVKLETTTSVDQKIASKFEILIEESEHFKLIDVEFNTDRDDGNQDFSSDELLTTFEEGRIYRTVFDGQSYTSQCKKHNKDHSTVYVLGNESLFIEGDDTGEPFLIIYYSSIHDVQIDSSNIFSIICAGGDSNVHTIEIYSQTEVSGTLLEELIPDSVALKTDVSDAIAAIPVMPPVTTEDNGKFLQVVDGVWAAVTIAFADGGSF